MQLCSRRQSDVSSNSTEPEESPKEVRRRSKRIKQPPTESPIPLVANVDKRSSKRGSLERGDKKEKKIRQSTKIKNVRVCIKPLEGKFALSMAKNRLHASSVPKSLPCRESQCDDIYNFVNDKLNEQIGGCMYISGVPGTGKTATVYEVVKKLQDENQHSFKFVEINGLRLSDPNQFYVEFLYQLRGEKMSVNKAADELNEMFSNPMPKEEFIVILVDELDLLRNRKQNILYHLFDWPSRTNSNLVVLAIANAMDLPERLLMNRVVSRLGLTRLVFHPYTFKELQQIVSSRLSGLNVFNEDSLQLICRKVAAVSGDARRALDISRRALELCELAEQGYYVNMVHVDKALKEIFTSPKLVAIQNASVQEQTFLKALVQDFRISGLEEAEFINVYKHHIEICQFESIYVPTSEEVVSIAQNLSSLRLIIFENSKSILHRLIRLNVSVDDVNFALTFQNGQS